MACILFSGGLRFWSYYEFQMGWFDFYHLLGCFGEKIIASWFEKVVQSAHFIEIWSTMVNTPPKKIPVENLLTAAKYRQLSNMVSIDSSLFSSIQMKSAIKRESVLFFWRFKFWNLDIKIHIPFCTLECSSSDVVWTPYWNRYMWLHVKHFQIKY